MCLRKACFFPGISLPISGMERKMLRMRSFGMRSKSAQAEEFVRASNEADFPRRLPRGAEISAAARSRRLAIARALARKPLVYLFDDSFSALDFKTDAALRRRLAGKIGQKCRGSDRRSAGQHDYGSGTDYCAGSRASCGQGNP